MSSLNIKELKIDDILKGRISNKFSLISLKRDGTLMRYIDGDLLSDRGINRNARYPHIVAKLRSINSVNLIGEVYIDGGNVFDISSSRNWRRARFMPFDIFNPNSFSPLWKRIDIVLETVKECDCDFITTLKTFDSVEEGWAYVLEHNEEGLVLRNEYEMFKVKKLEEAKVKIVRHEKGKGHGTFILENGSRVSGTKMDFVHQFEEMKEETSVIAEIEFPFITDSGKFFQPRLRRVVAEVGT